MTAIINIISIHQAAKVLRSVKTKSPKAGANCLGSKGNEVYTLSVVKCMLLNTFVPYRGLFVKKHFNVIWPFFSCGNKHKG
jgi:hypothetical protein